MRNMVAPVICFGKLPAYSDFVRYNAGSPATAAFDQWLREGMDFARNQLDQTWDKAYQSAPAHYFFYAHENSPQFLLGILKPSRDKNERKYPFILALQIDAGKFDRNLTILAPVIFASFLERARWLFEYDFNSIEKEEINRFSDELSFTFPENYLALIQPYGDYLSLTTLERFWRTLLGGFEDGRKYLVFKNLVEAVFPMRGYNLSRINLGFRFPLSAEKMLNKNMVCFWQDVLIHLLDSPQAKLPVVLWSNSRGESRNYLFVYFRPPAARNFLNLLDPDAENDSVCKVEEDGLGRIESARNSLPEHILRLLENKEMNLMEFLERL